jgi:hypothetical protein
VSEGFLSRPAELICCVLGVLCVARVCFSTQQRIGATSQFKFCFAFVLNLVAEFRLLDKKTDATTLLPLQQLSREIRERCY